VNRITIREEPFDSPDAAALRRALRADLDARYGADLEPGTKLTAADAAVFLVAREGTEGLADDPASAPALGCGALRAVDGETVEIKRMYVVPEARGRGIGRLLLRALEARGRAMGFRRIVLETGIEQPEAIALYAGHGFVPVPCWGAYSGVSTSHCFERRLD
jgi:putative acetyltransferase